MTIIERIQNLAKKTTGQDISGETIREALESFEKAVDSQTQQKSRTPQEKQEHPKRRGYSSSKFGDDD